MEIVAIERNRRPQLSAAGRFAGVAYPPAKYRAGANMGLTF